MLSPIETRIADHGDVHAIANLVRPLWIEHADRAAHLQIPEDVSAMNFPDYIGESMGAPNENWLIALTGLRIVGAVRLEEISGRNPLYRHPSLLLIDDIAVAPEVRGQGVATRLLQDCEVIAKARGIGLLQAMIYEWNAASQATFTKAGYAQTRSDFFRVIP